MEHTIVLDPISESYGRSNGLVDLLLDDFNCAPTCLKSKENVYWKRELKSTKNKTKEKIQTAEGIADGSYDDPLKYNGITGARGPVSTASLNIPSLKSCTVKNPRMSERKSKTFFKIARPIHSLFDNLTVNTDLQ